MFPHLCRIFLSPFVLLTSLKLLTMTETVTHTFVDLPDGGSRFVFDDDASVATTALANDVGSVVGRPKDAFLRSITFFQGQEWGIELVDPPKKGQIKRPIVQSVSGIIGHSKIEEGDVLKSVNGKKIGPSYNSARSLELMHQRMEEDGVLSIAVGNDYGDDVLIQVTVVKPKAEMTCEELGLSVWEWSGLCIHKIRKDSIFDFTVLKEYDYIETINGIEIAGTKVTPEGFEHIVNNLPIEITIIVKRGKQRWSGRFG